MTVPCLAGGPRGALRCGLTPSHTLLLQRPQDLTTVSSTPARATYTLLPAAPRAQPRLRHTAQVQAQAGFAERGKAREHTWDKSAHPEPASGLPSQAPKRPCFFVTVTLHLLGPGECWVPIRICPSPREHPDRWWMLPGQWAMPGPSGESLSWGTGELAPRAPAGKLSHASPSPSESWWTTGQRRHGGKSRVQKRRGEMGALLPMQIQPRPSTQAPACPCSGNTLPWQQDHWNCPFTHRFDQGEVGLGAYETTAMLHMVLRAT